MKYYLLHISKHTPNYLAEGVGDFCVNRTARVILPTYSMPYDDAYRYRQSMSISNGIFVHIIEEGVKYSFCK